RKILIYLILYDTRIHWKKCANWKIMSENGSSQYSNNTRGSHPHSEISGTNVPLPLVTAYKGDVKSNKSNPEVLPKLPSHRFRWTNWHELRNNHIQGPQLKAPRVREGPPEKEEQFYTDKNDEGELMHTSKKGKERKDYQDKAEDWEEAEFANLSFQDLQHKYQKDNFLRVLKRLHVVEELNLIDNNLTDLSSVTFPKCEFLNLNRNHIASFKSLPKLPKVKYLSVGENNITLLDGIDNLRKSPIDILYLKGNSVVFTEYYRQRVFLELPHLKVLDGIPKLPSDTAPLPDDFVDKSSTCVIS
ncbi:unnamed protein product, partial [Owenia fusiformis]